MLGQRNILYHAIAIVTVVIWGTTFVSTKILINIGLSPAEIMLYRFVLAYFCMLPFAYKKRYGQTVLKTSLMLLARISGGSLCYMAEEYGFRHSAGLQCIVVGLYYRKPRLCSVVSALQKSL